MRSTAPFSAIMQDGKRLTGEVSLLVTTALAYRELRLQYFLDMIRCFAEMPVRRVTFFIYVNTTDPDALRVVEEMFDICRTPDRILELRPRVDLDHPYALCWQHKELFEAEFLPGDYTHFVHLEDDMRFSLLNLQYFLGAREALRPFGLIPSFIRYEWNIAQKAAFASDQGHPIRMIDLPVIDAGDHWFTVMPSVYCACFMMDRELATEYIATRSFDRERSKEVFGWEISERAAMGLAFENPPEGYNCRYNVAVAKHPAWPAPCAWVLHWPGNFTNDPNTVLGKRRMDNIIVGDDYIATP